MALKGDRVVGDGGEISFFMNETATRGVCVVFDTSASGSGVAMDQAEAKVKLPDVANSSGEYPVGILLNDMVNIDPTRQHINQHKDEVQLGGKVTVLKYGQVTTSSIYSGQTPGPGLMAYAALDGTLMAGTSVPNDTTRIGTWMSKKDADGYAKLQVNITTAVAS
jgi:hypothetical protein